MGAGIIEKDVVLLIMILNGQLENIMHDMMQLMMLFCCFMRKFFSQRHKCFWWVLKVEMRTIRY